MKTNFAKYAVAGISFAAILSIASLAGVVQFNDITAEGVDREGYKFAESVDVVAVFEFNGGEIEIVPVEVFNFSTDALDTEDNSPNFELKSIVGETPYLHKQVEKARHYNGAEANVQYPHQYFNVEVVMGNVETGKVYRTVDYRQCEITGYNIETLHDKEEGWTTSKGFAVTEAYTFDCHGMDLLNPTLDELYEKYDKADAPSTMDMVQPDETWENHPKFQSNGMPLPGQ